MDDDVIPPSGRRVLRLFPLPGVVHFPHTVLPLHIFEPRYRQMTEDALAGDRLVTIIMVRPAPIGEFGPPLEEFGCVGRILRCQRLPDGRFNFLLVGLRRVRLVREVPSEKLYRTAEVDVIEDVVDEDALLSRKMELVSTFRDFLAPRGGLPADFDAVFSAETPAGAIADIIAHALPIPPETKQDLLAEPRVDARLDLLLTWLRVASPLPTVAESPERFPPPFSSN